MSQEKENPIEIATESERGQSREGDALPPDFQCVLPDTVKLQMRKDDNEDLLRCWARLSKSDQKLFCEKYGRIADLLKIEVKQEILEALLHHWDPSYRCFTFGMVDLVPLIEEYEELLNIPPSNQNRVYIHDPRQSGARALSNTLGYKARFLTNSIVKKGKTEGWLWSNLKEDFETHLTDPDPQLRLKLLALAIYGLVLLPSAVHVIDGGAAMVFAEAVRKGGNPIPAILAETFMTLGYCRRTGGGALKCCSQLLYVWFISHALLKPRIFHNVYWKDRNPLAEFARYPWAGYEWESMEAIAKRLGDGMVLWAATWMPPKPLLVRCGQFPWVPLFGARGCISYAPALALRQTGRAQFIPRTAGLAEFEFMYGDRTNIGKFEDAKASWYHQQSIEETHGGRSTTRGYPTWQRTRGKNYRVPRSYGPDKPLPRPDGVEDYYEEFWARQEAHFQEWENRRLELEEGNGILEVENEMLQEQIEVEAAERQGLRQEIDALRESEQELKKRKRELEEENEQLAKRVQLGKQVEDQLKVSEEHNRFLTNELMKQDMKVMQLQDQTYEQDICLKVLERRIQSKGEEVASCRRTIRLAMAKAEYATDIHHAMWDRLALLDPMMRQAGRIARAMYPRAEELWDSLFPTTANSRLRGFLSDVMQYFKGAIDVYEAQNARELPSTE